MKAIINRELGAYFSSPVGYVFLTVFYVFSGFFFFAGVLARQSSDISYVFSNMFSISLFLIPVLTMRLFSEDRKHRTDQAFLTAPIHLTTFVLGKFFSALLVFMMGQAITFIYMLIIASLATPNWSLYFGNFFALLFLGMALISIGMFISALTESQIVAAIGAFAAGLFILLLDSVSGLFQSRFVAVALSNISFIQRYKGFASGIFDLADVFFFLSVCTLFIFLTVRVHEKRRWS